MLFVVSTPIGNLSDITQRALDIIKNCDAVICEDTRVSLKLLSYYGISKKILRYNETSKESVDEIVQMMASGMNLCLISDAGTPCISDPGWRIVKLAREKGIDVRVIGVNSACIAGIAGSGFDGSRFVFLGFLPRAKSRMIKMLSAILYDFPVIVYESPNRVIRLLELVLKNFGDIDCVVARELTKLHEEWIKGSVSNVLSALLQKKEIKGEITVIFSKPDKILKKISRVGFVSSSNTCRSVLAFAYAVKLTSERKLDIIFDSAGLWVQENANVDENVLRLISNEGIKNFIHTPKQIDRAFIELNDIILVMTKEHKNKLLLLFPEHSKKVFTLNEYTGYGGDIYDPYGKDYVFYEMIFKQIKRSVDALLAIISKT